MKRGWTHEGLALLYAGSLTLGGDLRALADLTGRTRSECDQALWALAGRTPQQALERLNAAATEPAPPRATAPLAAESSTLAAFMRETFA